MSFRKIAILGSLFLGLTSWAVSSEACLERPKSFAFSSMESFKGVVELDFGTNCSVRMSAQDANSRFHISYPSKYDLSQGAKAEICVHIYKNPKPNEKSQEPEKICGESLRQINDKLNLKDSSGRVVGRIYVDARGRLVIEDNKTLARIAAEIQSSEKWAVVAEERNGAVSGRLDLVSYNCTRGLPPAGSGEIDLRGNHYGSTPGGCQSGLEHLGPVEMKTTQSGKLSVEGKDLE